MRAKRTHPTTSAQHVRAALKPPKPQPKPAQPTPARPPQAEPAMTLDMISTKTGREQAEIFMRQQAKWIEAEIEAGKRATIAK